MPATVQDEKLKENNFKCIIIDLKFKENALTKEIFLNPFI
jgi:hypothetical protein